MQTPLLTLQPFLRATITRLRALAGDLSRPHRQRLLASISDDLRRVLHVLGTTEHGHGTAQCAMDPPRALERAQDRNGPSDLGLLACGTPNVVPGGPAWHSELGKILAHLQASLDYVMDQLSWLADQEPRRISMLGPFLGRSLLELSATALIGRLDPVRLLVVRKIQEQPDYEISIPWKGSIRWQGDVLAAKKVGDLWGEAVEYEKVTKALLGDYYEHLLWRPAVEHVLERGVVGGVWLAEIAAIDAAAFVPRKRHEIGVLYSSLSKGIHHEFVIPPGALYDRATVVDLVQRTVHLVADLALVSHFIGHASFSLNHDQAFDVFNRIENFEVLR
jgi:hypothetical protein